ncbi:MAG: TetR/AcrR family transcriptional regulator [Candidatus Rokubacteria bacterium]|nr:TetR/AcrR family transcriptional regulator [Candidatus Rokubacteria bacterium]
MGTSAGRAGRRPRREDTTGTREALLGAAADLFAERGYDGVPLSSIAARARVNKAMIRYHFGGKRGLYLSILTTAFAEIVARAEELAAAPGPAPEQLRMLVAALADIGTRRQPHLFTMMLREVMAGGKHMAPAVLEKPARVLAAVRQIVERGVRDGAFRPVDPVLTHLSLVGSVVFFFATGPFRERVLADRRLGIAPPDPAAYVRHIQDLITHGLAAPRRALRPPGSVHRSARVAAPPPRKRAPS